MQETQLKEPPENRQTQFTGGEDEGCCLWLRLLGLDTGRWHRSTPTPGGLRTGANEDVFYG